MAIQHATAVRTAVADLVVDRIDAGAAAGTLKVYTGTIGTTTTLLTTHTLNDPAAGNAAAGVATFNAIGDGTVAAGGGVAGWFRIEDSDGNDVFDGTITETGGGGDLEFDETTWAEGGTVSIGSGTYTAPV